MNNFAKGVIVRTIQTQYGELIKIGIDTQKLFDNPINDSGYANLILKKSKNGKWYAENDTYNDKTHGETNDEDAAGSEDDWADSIPF